jgi:hypothetical protein
MNGNALRKLRDDDVAWDWATAQLHDEAHHIRVALDELQEMGNPDWTAALSLWQLQFDGLRFVAQGLSDPVQRARLEQALEVRRAMMNSILAKVRKQAAKRGRVNG